jgi:hypothetical protein
MRSSKKRPHQHVNESTPLGEKRKVKALQTSFRACNRLYVTWHIQFDLIRIVDGCTSKYSSGEIRLRIEAICDYWSNCMTVLSICSVKTKVLSDYHTHLVKSNLQANRIYLRRVGIQYPSLMVSTTKDLDEPITADMPCNRRNDIRLVSFTHWSDILPLQSTEDLRLATAEASQHWTSVHPKMWNQVYTSFGTQSTLLYEKGRSRKSPVRISPQRLARWPCATQLWR